MFTPRTVGYFWLSTQPGLQMWMHSEKEMWVRIEISSASKMEAF